MKTIEKSNRYNILRGILALLVVLFFSVLGLGYLSLPKVKDIDSNSFSASRIERDIKVISAVPHSIQHPENRLKVRDYLAAQLAALGASPRFLDYDSVTFRTGGYGSISNIFAEFPPDKVDSSGNETYILLIAHYDSCFEQNVLGRKVYSYGAADDGYGVGVILELVRQANSYSNQWSQGIRVLFTDAEENYMSGMKNALGKDRYIFDNVGCIINVEARGVKGPAYLFETSPGNAPLMELYKKAENPFTYSLASVVYRALPNYTDFTLIKDSIPGYNFSVLDNMEYYHTDEDRFDNIHLPSLQHYGQQIVPLLREYLTNPVYSDPQYLKSSQDVVAFSLPALGLFCNTTRGYLFFYLEVLAFFIIFCIFQVKRHVISVKTLFMNALKLFLFSLGLILLGTFLAWISALAVGDHFHIIGTKFVWFDEILLILTLLIVFVLYLHYHIRKTKSDENYYMKSLLSANLILGILSLVLYVPFGENFFLILPMVFSMLSVLISRFRYARWVALLGLALLTVLSTSFIYVLYTALTIGSLGIVLFVALYDMILIVDLFNCYTYPWKNA